MDVSKFLNHSAEFHHVHGSAGYLSWNFILALFSNEVLPDDTEESAHVGVWFDHWFESLHLIDLNELVLQLVKLSKLHCSNLTISSKPLQRSFRSLLLTRHRKAVRFSLGFRSLLLIGFLFLKVVVKLLLKPDHLLPDMHQTGSNMCLSRLLKSKSILHALIRFRCEDLATCVNANFLLVDVLRLLMVSSSSKFVKS